MDERSGRSRTLYLIFLALAAVALALGLWDVLIEADGGGNPLLQVAFPAALVVLAALLYRRERGV